MMEILNNLAFGFEHALTLENLMYCALGCTVGTLIGLLPGLGPLSTISLLLPITYTIPPAARSSCWRVSITARSMATASAPSP